MDFLIHFMNFGSLQFVRLYLQLLDKWWDVLAGPASAKCCACVWHLTVWWNVQHHNS